jgi:hypothetical protein
VSENADNFGRGRAHGLERKSRPDLGGPGITDAPPTTLDLSRLTDAELLALLPASDLSAVAGAETEFSNRQMRRQQHGARSNPERNQSAGHGRATIYATKGARYDK